MTTISLSQLESHLWESANILRGPVAAADFKTYIFPLLFFKRICDVWDEEYQEIVDETGDEQLAWFPESHRFQIPEDCHWNDVRTKASNVGAALQHAMREIEKANPETLYGVFGDAQWSNKERLSDALLKDLIEHFSRLSFGNKIITSVNVTDSDESGDVQFWNHFLTVRCNGCGTVNFCVVTKCSEEMDYDHRGNPFLAVHKTCYPRPKAATWASPSDLSSRPTCSGHAG